MDLDDDELRAAGPLKWAVDEPGVIPAWVAEMDFAVPEPIQRAVDGVVRRGVFGYADPRDRAEIARALADFAQARWGHSVDPGRVVLVGDVIEALGLTLRHLARPGALIVPTPVYPPFLVLGRACGRELVQVPLLRGADGPFRGRLTLDVDAIDRHAAAGASTLLLCHPHNPVGRCYTRAELEAVAEVAIRHDLHVISDEIHAPLALPGVAFVPFAAVAPPEMALSTLMSATKAFSMPGLRCAQVISHREQDHARLTQLHPALNHAMTTLGQRATLAAYREGGPWLDTVRSRIADNHERFRRALAASVPEVLIEPAEATYLAWLDIAGLAVADPAGAALDHLVRVDGQGAGYGLGGQHHVRVNLATSPARVDEIAARLARAWGAVS
ncbi:MAG: aminotransferase class I/II-fold pyridoxal phosphate-dependent enzyme [Ornithinimicrobium sp.]